MGSRNPTTQRIAAKITNVVDRLCLDLSGLRVLTEAATGPYAVTPVIAALAGAEVTALTRDSSHGTVAQVRRQTDELAREMGMEDRIQIVESLREEEIAAADVVTNSGHLRPLDARFVEQMTPGTVVPLMYESWELRDAEIDLEACRRRGVIVAGTNERHPNLRVFDYLGLLALHGLFQCKVPVAFSKLLLVCDNPFCPFILKRLLDCGATVDVLGPDHCPDIDAARRVQADEPGSYDAVIVADTPTKQPVIGTPGESKYSRKQIGEFGALVQIWGDVDRSCLNGAACYPADAPAKGHMGILLSELGPDPIIRLQSGGLKVGQVLASQQRASAGIDSEPSYVDAVVISPKGCHA